MKHRERRILSFLYLVSLSLLSAFAIHGMAAAEASSVQTVPHPKIIIDAGHGGPDGGTSGADGTRESDLNLAIALKTDLLLSLLGEESVLSRTGEDDLSDPTAQTIAQKKVSDIRNRVAFVEGQGDCILISIHGNAFQDRAYSGAQVFYGNGSEVMGKYLQTALTKLQPENDRKAKPVSRDIYLMNHVSVPAVLVECGFLSNEKELSLLKNEEYQRKLAVVIGVAAANYLGGSSPGV